MGRSRGDGLYRRPDSAIWWMSYQDALGRRVRMSTGTSDKGAAQSFLDDRRGRVVQGEPVVTGAHRVTVNDLADDLETEYKVNARRSLDRLQDALTHVRRAFGTMKAQAITTSGIRAYIAQRQSAGAANATINLELAALKRSFRLAVEGGRLLHRPHVPMLEVRNARKGFFDREQVESLLKHLPDCPGGLRDRLAHPFRSPHQAVETRRSRQWLAAVGAGRNQKLRGAHVSVNPGSSESPGGAARGHQRLGAGRGADYPVGLPPRRAADRQL